MKPAWHITMPGGVALLPSVRVTRQEAIEHVEKTKRVKWKTLYMRGWRCKEGDPRGAAVPGQG